MCRLEFRPANLYVLMPIRWGTARCASDHMSRTISCGNYLAWRWCFLWSNCMSVDLPVQLKWYFNTATSGSWRVSNCPPAFVSRLIDLVHVSDDYKFHDWKAVASTDSQWLLLRASRLREVVTAFEKHLSSPHEVIVLTRTGRVILSNFRPR